MSVNILPMIKFARCYKFSHRLYYNFTAITVISFFCLLLMTTLIN